MPELAPPLIDGVLRQGHKMLIAGPSKAGKSFALIEMCIAIAEGEKWFGWQCAKGWVMYVNLELDRASYLHLFKDVYTSLQISANKLSNIDNWNLRGKSIPMDELAPKLIRCATKKDYIAIILDPIYKVITGDENSADQMANFCNQFDKICNELGTAVIYCHHHSKGAQGGKCSMDRASGSGVFARDHDALLDLIELDLNDAVYKQLKNNAVCDYCINYLNNNYPGWRIEGTLREFPRFEPEDTKPLWQKASEKRKKHAQENKKKTVSEFEIVFSNIKFEGREVSAQELSDKLNVSSKTLLSCFGNSQKQKPELVKNFETYFGEDGKKYIKRKSAPTYAGWVSPT